MGFELLRAILALIQSGADLPDDWNDEDKVESWLDGMNSPLAKLIVLITPDEALKLKAAAARAAGKDPSEFDWDMVIDWIAGILVTLLPQYETFILFVAELLKQVLDLILKNLPKMPEGEVKTWLKKTLA